MSSMPEWWTVPYPEVSSARTATDYLDAIGAGLSRYEDGDMYVLATGPQELIRADTPEELDTFVLGFALAHLICERFGLIGARPGTAQAAGPPDAITDEPQTLTAVPDEPDAPPVAAVAEVTDVAEVTEVAVTDVADPVPDVPPPDEPVAPVQTLTAVADIVEDDSDDDSEDGSDNGSNEPVAQARAGRRRGRR